MPATTTVASAEAVRMLTESDYKCLDDSAEYSEGNMDRADEIKLRKIFIVATKIAAVTRANLLGHKRMKRAFPPIVHIATVTVGKWILTPDASLLEHDVNAAIKTEQAEKWVAGEANAEALAPAELNKAAAIKKADQEASEKAEKDAAAAKKAAEQAAKRLAAVDKKADAKATHRADADKTTWYNLRRH